MKLKVREIHAHGNADQEYIVIDVTQNCDLGHYQIADTTYYENGTISNKVRHTYWFTSKIVPAGDIVLLYTGIGNDSVLPVPKNNLTVHSFYWGLKEAVWNDTGDAAILFELSDWKTTKSG